MSNEIPTEYPGVTVAEWCRIYGYGSVAKLARATGCHWRSMRDIAENGAVPRPELAVAIEIATRGQIRAETTLRLGELRAKLTENMKAAEALPEPVALLNVRQ